jgi:hypothetical protein
MLAAEPSPSPEVLTAPQSAAETAERTDVLPVVDSAGIVPASSLKSRPSAANDVAATSDSSEPKQELTRRERRALAHAEQQVTGTIAGDGLPDGGASEETRQSLAAFLPLPSAPVLTTPTGHWSAEDAEAAHDAPPAPVTSYEDLLLRGSGAGGIPSTSNALILPSIPQQGAISGPLTSTGEIMLTGSIDLPMNFGRSAATASQFDSAEIDGMLDDLGDGRENDDVTPVSASRAVSSHVSTRGVLAPPRKRWGSLPIVLSTVVAVLAVGVIALFVVGYALQIF